ncbi:hypothetical protein M404DRAFT_146557, partial [Pisolithus tinctorius Marx 270]
SPTPTLVTYTLSTVVKPLFAATPHPRLHLATARVLARPADTQDTYHHQPWKDCPGLEEVLRWCILNTQSPTYEQIWPLILPPTMTFLDDYEVPYKVLGVRLISDMLTCAPPELLLRTGVDALLFTSLTNALNHLRDPSTPELIRAVVPTTLQLIDLTTPSPFNRLSTLLSSSILGTVILTGVPHPTLVAASHVLPPVISALGVGAARFLKGIVPVVEKTGQAQVNINEPLALHLGALHVVNVLIDTCPSRIARWSTTITDGLARCWVGCVDAVSTDTAPARLEVLRGRLQEVAMELATACPRVVRVSNQSEYRPLIFLPYSTCQNEFTQLLEFDQTLFDGLVGSICTTQCDDPTLGVVAMNNSGNATSEIVS